MNLIVAVDENWGIGKDNELLCRISADMKNFRAVTMGHVLVLGRKTLESFPGKEPLPKRTHIVLTANKAYEAEGVILCHSLEELPAVLADYEDDDIFVIGGGSIYTALLGRCRHACVTRVDAAAENADTFFPNLDALPEWTVERTEAPVTENGLTYRFVDYVNTAL